MHRDTVSMDTIRGGYCHHSLDNLFLRTDQHYTPMSHLSSRSPPSTYSGTQVSLVRQALLGVLKPDLPAFCQPSLGPVLPHPDVDFTRLTCNHCGGYGLVDDPIIEFKYGMLFCIISSNVSFLIDSLSGATERLYRSAHYMRQQGLIKHSYDAANKGR